MSEPIEDYIAALSKLSEPLPIVSDFRPRAELDENGHELVDSTPIAPPVGHIRQPSIREQIRDMVRGERLAAEASAAGYETFDEADDFDIADDIDPTSAWEEQFDPVGFEPGARERLEALYNQKLQEGRGEPSPPPAEPKATPPQPKAPKEPKTPPPLTDGEN